MKTRSYKPGQLYTIKDPVTKELRSYRIVKTTRAEKGFFYRDGIFDMNVVTYNHKLPRNMELQPRIGTVTFKMINCEFGGKECSFRAGIIVSDYSYVITYRQFSRPDYSCSEYEFAGVFYKKNGDNNDWKELKKNTGMPKALRTFLEKKEFEKSRILSVSLCNHLGRCPAKTLCYYAQKFPWFVRIDNDGTYCVERL